MLYFLKEKGLLTYNALPESKAYFAYFERMGCFSESGEITEWVINNRKSSRKYISSASVEISNIINAIGIYSHSEHKDEAFDFIMRTQMDPYLNNLLVFGPKEDYTINNGRAEGARNEVINFSRFGNLSICYPHSRYSDTIHQDYYDAYSTASVVPYLGFAPDISAVKDEYLAVRDTMLCHDFLDYLTPADSINALNQKLEKAGIQMVIDEINRQYGEWEDKNR